MALTVGLKLLKHKTAAPSLLRGQTVRKRFPLEDQSYFNNLYFRFIVIPFLTDGPRIVTEGSHSCHLVNVDPIRLLLLVQLLLSPGFISST